MNNNSAVTQGLDPVQPLYVYRRDPYGKWPSNRRFSGTIRPPYAQRKKHTLTHTPFSGYNFGQKLHFCLRFSGVVWAEVTLLWLPNFWGKIFLGNFSEKRPKGLDTYDIISVNGDCLEY